MIKLTYQMPDEESFESNTRRQVSTTKVATIEMLGDIAKMLHDQNYDLNVSIRVKVPK